MYEVLKSKYLLEKCWPGLQVGLILIVGGSGSAVRILGCQLRGPGLK